MAQVIDAFLMTLGYDTRGLAKGKEEAKRAGQEIDRNWRGDVRRIDQSTQVITRGLGTLKREVLSLGAVFVGGMGVKSFVQWWTTADAQLGRTSRAIGVNAKVISTWANAIEAAGGSASDAEGDFRRLVTIAQNARRGEVPAFLPVMEYFGLGGIEELDAPEKFLDKVRKRVASGDMKKEMADNLMQQMQLSQGFRDLALLPLDQQDEMFRRGAGSAAGKSATDAAEDLLRRFTEIKNALLNIGRQIMEQFGPEITKVLERVDKWLSEDDNRKWLGEQIKAIGEFFRDMAVGANDVAKALGGWENVLIGIAALWAGGKIAPLLLAMTTFAGVMSSPAVLGALAAWTLWYTATGQFMSQGASAEELAHEANIRTSRMLNPGGADLLPGVTMGPAGPSRSGFAEAYNAVRGWLGGGRARTSEQQDRAGAEAMAWWVSQGMDPIHAAGMAAQEVSESGGDPRARGDGGNAHGLYQWHPARRAAILAATGIDVSTANTADQRRAAAWELRNTEQAAARRLLGARTAGDAGVAATEYERPADRLAQEQLRGSMAQRFFNQSLEPARRRGTLPRQIDPSIVPGAAPPAGALLGSVGTNNLNIANLTVQTQATDARGISGAITQELRNQWLRGFQAQSSVG